MTVEEAVSQDLNEQKLRRWHRRGNCGAIVGQDVKADVPSVTTSSTTTCRYFVGAAERTAIFPTEPEKDINGALPSAPSGPLKDYEDKLKAIDLCNRGLNKAEVARRLGGWQESARPVEGLAVRGHAEQRSGHIQRCQPHTTEKLGFSEVHPVGRFRSRRIHLANVLRAATEVGGYHVCHHVTKSKRLLWKIAKEQSGERAGFSFMLRSSEQMRQELLPQEGRVCLCASNEAHPP